MITPRVTWFENVQKNSQIEQREIADLIVTFYIIKQITLEKNYLG